MYKKIRIVTIIFSVLFCFFILDHHHVQADTIHHEVCGITSASAVISWVTEGASTGYIHYSDDPNMTFCQTAVDVRGASYSGTTHQVLLSGLTEKTPYYFELCMDSIINDNEGLYYTFRTTGVEGIGAPKNIFGRIYLKDGNTPAEGALVFARVNNSRCLTTLSEDNGYWVIELSNLKDPNGAKMTYAHGDTLSIIANRSPQGEGRASLLLTDDNPQDCGSIALKQFQSNTMELSSGFNLIALPLYPLTDKYGNAIDMRASDLILQIPEAIQIFAWDTITQAWASILKNEGVVIGRDFPLKREKGYFIQVKSPASHTFFGKEITPPVDLRLKAGFNLSRIYDAPPIQQSAYSLFNTTPKCRQIFGWKRASQSWESALRVDSVVLGSDFDIDFDSGYFLQMENDLLWPVKMDEKIGPFFVWLKATPRYTRPGHQVTIEGLLSGYNEDSALFNATLYLKGENDRNRDTSGTERLRDERIGALPLIILPDGSFKATFTPEKTGTYLLSFSAQTPNNYRTLDAEVEVTTSGLPGITHDPGDIPDIPTDTPSIEPLEGETFCVAPPMPSVYPEDELISVQFKDQLTGLVKVFLENYLEKGRNGELPINPNIFSNDLHQFHSASELGDFLGFELPETLFTFHFDLPSLICMADPNRDDCGEEQLTMRG